nr:putative reverse transcriptase domain-containing protein [Tanacetum cinerariifolium]
MAPNRRSRNNKGEQPNIAAIIAQQLQAIISQIVNQVTTNVNNANANNANGGNANGGNGNGGNGNGGAISLTQWIKKMENVIDNSGCAENQKVKYATSSLVNKALTWWNTQVQERGREAAMGMSLNDFQALLVEEFCPSNEMEKAGILTDEAVIYGTLTKGNEKRKVVEETSKLGASWKENKKAKVGTGFMATAPLRNENQVIFAKDYRAPIRPVAPMYRAAGQAGNQMALEGNRNTRSNGILVRGWAFFVNVNAMEAVRDPNVVKEVADGKKVDVDSIIHDCKLELGSSLISINLISLGHESLDVIVGMDRLSQNNVVIVCHEKVVEIPLEYGRTLRVYGERHIGIAKAIKNAKVNEPKFVDISVVRDFENVFPEDLSGLPPQQQVEFRIDLVPGATSVAKSPYHLAPSKMQELSGQLQELQDKGFIRPSHSP